LLFAICLSSCHKQEKIEIAEKQPKSVILFIGDGMGPAYLKAYRMIKDNPNTSEIETTLFDRFFVGSLRTDPQSRFGEVTDSSASAKALATGKKTRVTDSAASATAYATGHKTVNGSLSVSAENESFVTILERAKHLGKSTGMVVTSQIYHATPAAFLAHEADRDNYTEISNQFYDNQFEGRPYIDVLLGGGRKYFMRKSRNLAKEFEAIGYEVLSNRTELLSSKGEQLLGLFAEIGLPKKLDRSSEIPSLAEMTNIAIERLSNNKNGFFLMVEGSQIDWAGHENDIVGAMTEMEDFEMAIAEGINFAKNNPNIQIIITADHSTGGLSVGASVDGTDHYQWNSEVVRSFKNTPNEIVSKAKKSGNLLAEFERASDIHLTKVERLKLSQFNPKRYYQALELVNDIINRHSYTGWTTKGHTGVDVNLYAYGPASSKLVGNWDNTKLAEFMFDFIAE